MRLSGSRKLPAPATSRPWTGLKHGCVGNGETEYHLGSAFYLPGVPPQALLPHSWPHAGPVSWSAGMRRHPDSKQASETLSAVPSRLWAATTPSRAEHRLPGSPENR